MLKSDVDEHIEDALLAVHANILLGKYNPHPDVRACLALIAGAIARQDAEGKKRAV